MTDLAADIRELRCQMEEIQSSPPFNLDARLLDADMDLSELDSTTL